MEMGSISSLAEVGVGINLGFSLIQSVRQRLIPLLENNLSTQKEKIKTIISDYCTNSGQTAASHRIIDIDDIETGAKSLFLLVEKVFVVIAIIAASSLIYYLYEAGAHPKRDVSISWADFTLCLVVAPIVGNYLTQLSIYYVARKRLLRLKKKYKEATDLLGSTIDPATPSS